MLVEPVTFPYTWGGEHLMTLYILDVTDSQVSAVGPEVSFRPGRYILQYD